jgi:hypothetical protein
LFEQGFSVKEFRADSYELAVPGDAIDGDSRPLFARSLIEYFTDAAVWQPGRQGQ